MRAVVSGRGEPVREHHQRRIGRSAVHRVGIIMIFHGIIMIFHEKMISPIPLRYFAFSGSQKLKNLLASQGRRLKAGVAKDLGGRLGGVHPEERDVM